MIDEARLRVDLDRAAKAKALLEDSMISDAFRTLETAYFDAWKGTGSKDEAKREKLWLAFNVIGKVRSHLQTAIADGELARHEIESMSEDRKRLFGVF